MNGHDCPPRIFGGSPLAQQQIDHPAAPHMLARLAAAAGPSASPQRAAEPPHNRLGRDGLVKLLAMPPTVMISRSSGVKAKAEKPAFDASTLATHFSRRVSQKWMKPMQSLA